MEFHDFPNFLERFLLKKEILEMDQIIRQTKFLSAQIFVTSRKFRHLSPTKFGPVRYTRVHKVNFINNNKYCFANV